MRRDVEDLLDQFASPRGLRREVDWLFGEDLSPRALYREMSRLFDEFESPPGLRRRMEHLFEQMGGRLSERGKEMYVPELELKEKDNEYVMTVDLPGMKKDDVEVRIDDDNILTICGERREEETKRGQGYEYSERGYGAFRRSVSLPRGIEPSRIEADFRNGVLEIHVPKSESAQRARKIAVGERKEAPRVMGSTDGGREAEQRPPR
jgi:HSP20 family protein